jgi:hypothetical protein
MKIRDTGHLNGYGSAATIGSPYGIAIDSSTGCIFFADQMYYNIRIVSTGNISTKSYIYNDLTSTFSFSLYNRVINAV